MIYLLTGSFYDYDNQGHWVVCASHDKEKLEQLALQAAKEAERWLHAYKRKTKLAPADHALYPKWHTEVDALVEKYITIDKEGYCSCDTPNFSYQVEETELV